MPRLLPLLLILGMVQARWLGWESRAWRYVEFTKPLLTVALFAVLYHPTKVVNLISKHFSHLICLNGGSNQFATNYSQHSPAMRYVKCRPTKLPGKLFWLCKYGGRQFANSSLRHCQTYPQFPIQCQSCQKLTCISVFTSFTARYLLSISTSFAYKYALHLAWDEGNFQLLKVTKRSLAVGRMREYAVGTTQLKSTNSNRRSRALETYCKPRLYFSLHYKLSDRNISPPHAARWVGGLFHMLLWSQPPPQLTNSTATADGGGCCTWSNCMHVNRLWWKAGIGWSI